MKRRDFLRSASALAAGFVFSKTSKLSAKEISSTNELPNLNPLATDSEMLDNLRRVIVDYYRNEANPRNGLIADRTQPGSPSSIAATGMGLSVYIVAVERNILSRPDAVDRTLTLLRFLHSSQQGQGAGRHRIQRILLSLPRHADRPPSYAMRIIDS